MKYSYPSLRRFHLDQVLNAHLHMMRGIVLDIGGKKENPRGRFRPPYNKVDKWIYINHDDKSKPDIVADVSSLPLENDFADFFLCTEVMEYIEKPKKLINEIKRVLKSDSRGIITIPFMNPIHGDYDSDKARYTRSYLEQLINDSGLEIIKIEELGSIGSVIYDILKIQTRESKSNLLNFILDKTILIFKLIDKLTSKSKKFVNTGYFILVKNP